MMWPDDTRKCSECGQGMNLWKPTGEYICASPDCSVHLNRKICTVEGCGAKAIRTEKDDGGMWRDYRCANGHMFTS
jgi:hypothetical protein